MKKTPFLGCKVGRLRQQGSAIFIILLAVFLLGALYYTFAKSTRANLGLIEAERNDAAQIASTDCQTAIAAATKRLQLRGCGTLISSAPDGSNANIGAPTDGSCSIYHVNGGGVKNCQNLVVSTDACDNSPAPGQVCADGSIYAGQSPDGNAPMFTTPADGGSFSWNSGTSDWTLANTNDFTDGDGNTAILASTDSDNAMLGDQVHNAAFFCSNLNAYGHTDWYLPAVDELLVFYDNEAAIGGFVSGEYWSSTEGYHLSNAYRVDFSSGNNDQWNKNYSMQIRCARKD